MSFSRLESIAKGSGVASIIVYYNSSAIENYVRVKLRDGLNMHRDYIIDVGTAKSLNNAKLDSLVPPMLCEKWLIHVNADEIGRKDLEKSFNIISNHAVTVYWTTKYRVFMQLRDIEIVKKQPTHFPYMSLTRLWYRDIKNLHNELVSKENHLDSDLLDYLANNYRYDVQAVMDILALLRSGNKFHTKKDIIREVGVGGNSVTNLVVRLLNTKPKTEDGRKKVLTSILQLMDDLSTSYPYRTMRNYMLNTLEGFIDIKQLQIMGIYGRKTREIPDTFDQKRLARLKRFDHVILNDVSLIRLLNLKLCLLNYRHFDDQIALIQAISEYVGSLELVKD